MAGDKFLLKKRDELWNMIESEKITSNNIGDLMQLRKSSATPWYDFFTDERLLREQRKNILINYIFGSKEYYFNIIMALSRVYPQWFDEDDFALINDNNYTNLIKNMERLKKRIALPEEDRNKIHFLILMYDSVKEGHTDVIDLLNILVKKSNYYIAELKNSFDILIDKSISELINILIGDNNIKCDRFDIFDFILRSNSPEALAFKLNWIEKSRKLWELVYRSEMERGLFEGPLSLFSRLLISFMYHDIGNYKGIVEKCLKDDNYRLKYFPISLLIFRGCRDFDDYIEQELIDKMTKQILEGDLLEEYDILRSLLVAVCHIPGRMDAMEKIINTKNYNYAKFEKDRCNFIYDMIGCVHWPVLVALGEDV